MEQAVIGFMMALITFIFELAFSILYGIVWLLLGWQLALTGYPVPACDVCLW